MESVNEIDVRDLCRICAAGSGKDALYPLLDGDIPTELGEIFEICIGLQVIVDDLPSVSDAIKYRVLCICSCERLAFRTVCATIVNYS